MFESARVSQQWVGGPQSSKQVRCGGLEQTINQTPRLTIPLPSPLHTIKGTGLSPQFRQPTPPRPPAMPAAGNSSSSNGNGNNGTNSKPLQQRPPRPATAPPFGGGAAERPTEIAHWTAKGEGYSHSHSHHHRVAARLSLSTSAVARRWGPLLVGAGGVDVLLGAATVAGIYRGDVRGFWDGAVDG